MLCVHQAKPLGDVTLTQALLDLRRDVLKLHPRGEIEPEFLTVGFHDVRRVCPR